MNEATKYNRAKTWQIALFALNMMSTNMYLFLMMYVSYYANGILGMSVVFVSTLATAMRIFDGFTDPIIGWLIDHTNGRFGKFRPFLVVGNALLALSMILLYKTTHLVPEALQIPYFIVVYALYIIYWLYRSGNSHNFCTDFTYKRSKTETDLRFLYRFFYAVLTDRNYNACFQLPCSEIWRNDT